MLWVETGAKFQPCFTWSFWLKAAGRYSHFQELYQTTGRFTGLQLGMGTLDLALAPLSHIASGFMELLSSSSVVSEQEVALFVSEQTCGLKDVFSSLPVSSESQQK